MTLEEEINEVLTQKLTLYSPDYLKGLISRMNDELRIEKSQSALYKWAVQGNARDA